ncbi:scoF [Symbiodinium sp. CCMP2592]|nr:scoF [Symbiodinium sp. CCMP2592]
MPLSVSQRRAAVRQFVADKHGRTLTKNGLQLPLFWLVDNGAHRACHRRVLSKAQTIDGWMGRRSDPTRCRGWSLPPTLRPDALRRAVAERRQAAVARVRQRRAERALGGLASQDRHGGDASETKRELAEEAGGLLDERKELGQDSEAQREPAGAVQLPEVELYATARDVAPPENDHPGPLSAVEEDGWEPPPRPSMPAMPGPPILAGKGAATLESSFSSPHDFLLEGSDDVDADLPSVGQGVAGSRETEAHTLSLGVETPLLSDEALIESATQAAASCRSCWLFFVLDPWKVSPDSDDMGASHSVELNANVACPSQPGTLCIATDPLDALPTPVTAEEAYEEAKAVMRYPVDSIAEGLMKKFELTEVDSKTFVVKAILDGQKLDKFGYGKGDGTDRVRLWKKVVMDDAALSLTVNDFVPEAALGAWVGEASDKVPLNKCIVQFERSPPKMYFIFDDQEGKRQADDAMKNGLYTWSDAIIGGVITFKTAKVKVTGNAPSIVDGGKSESMITSPMDDLVGYDKFWDKHLQYCKDFVKNMPGAQCEDISPDEFKGTVVLDPANPSEVTTHKIVSSKSDKKVNWTVEYQGKVVSEMHRIVHQSPLVLEGWDMDATGARVAGTSKAKEMQKAVNEIVAKASSWFG